MAQAMSAALFAPVYAGLPRPPDESTVERPRPERYTCDVVRDALPELEYQLEEAVVQGDVERVHEILARGADKDAPLDKDGRTALMIACAAGWMDLVKHLVEVEDVDIDGVVSRGGFRAIDYAGKEQHMFPNENDIVDYLKSKGSQFTWWGAAFAGDIRRLQVFIDHGQDVNEINPVMWNFSAVDCAIAGGCGKAAHFLVARGGLVSIRNCQVPLLDEQLASTGRNDAFMYKQWGLEKGEYFLY
uniref:Uncharacterized protein n=1 Tax=Noctiluca scintillans TaxID=2966 RepID=A0A7S1AVL6_NOCSC